MAKEKDTRDRPPHGVRIEGSDNRSSQLIYPNSRTWTPIRPSKTENGLRKEKDTT